MVLQKLNVGSDLEKRHELFIYNAMTYPDVKSFALTLHQDVLEKLTGKAHNKI